MFGPRQSVSQRTYWASPWSPGKPRKDAKSVAARSDHGIYHRGANTSGLKGPGRSCCFHKALFTGERQMRRAKTRLSLAVVALFASVAPSVSVDAAVIIKTFRCTICVTDSKHPDDCKYVEADGRAVVSEDALLGLEGELGQGATIMMATSRGAATPSGDQARHRRRHSDQHQPSPQE